MNYQSQKNKKSFSLKFKRNKNPLVFPLLFSLFIIQLQLVDTNTLAWSEEPRLEFVFNPPNNTTTLASSEDTTPSCNASYANIINQRNKIQNKNRCENVTEHIIDTCIKPVFLTKDEENLKVPELSCPANDTNNAYYSYDRYKKVKYALVGLNYKLAHCAGEIKNTVDCCKDPMKCFGSESGLNATQISFLMAALSGGITAFTGHNRTKAICKGLTAATAAAGFAQFGIGATCVVKAEICHRACNITEFEVIDTSDNIVPVNAEEVFTNINELQDDLKDFCNRSSRKGALMIAGSALLGTSAGLIAHHCEKIIGEKGGGSEDNDNPETVLNRNKNYCTKPENASRNFCRICNPESGTNAEEYNTNTLMRYSRCRELPVGGTLLETNLFSGGSGRSQIRISNQEPLNPSQKQGSELFSGYGRNAHSNLSQVSQISGPSGGENPSIGNSETTSSKLDPSSDEAEDQSQVSNQTSDIGFSGSGGGGSGSSGSFHSKGQTRSRWNLKDFLPGRKKDPKKKNLQTSRKNLLNVRSKQNNIFVTHSKIIHKFCSNKTLNQCHSVF